MLRHNQHVIDLMLINYNYLWDVYKGHCLKPEYGGFAKSGTVERLACRMQIDDFEKAIDEEKKPICDEDGCNLIAPCPDCGMACLVDFKR